MNICHKYSLSQMIIFIITNEYLLALTLSLNLKLKSQGAFITQTAEGDKLSMGIGCRTLELN